MADAKLTFFSFLLLFTLIFTGVRADAEGLHVSQEIRSHGPDDSSALKIELEHLKSKIQLLGSPSFYPRLVLFIVQF